MNTAELRAIAEAATQGPWAVDPEDEHHVIDAPEQEGSVIDFQEGRIGYALMNPANATYAAAFNPKTALALIAVVDAVIKEDRSEWSMPPRLKAALKALEAA